jgi:hypothetical protein
MINYIVGIVALAFTSIAIASEPDWVSVAENKSADALYIDRTSIRHTTDYITFTARLEYAQEKTAKMGSANVQVKSMNREMAIKCDSMLVAPIAVTYLNSLGDITYSGRLESSVWQSKFRVMSEKDITPAYKYVCKK